MTTQQAGEQFAQWLEQEHPDVYAVVYAQAVRSGLSGYGDVDDFTPTLTDISFDASDVSELSSVESSVDSGWANALDSIGSSSAPASSPVSAPNVVTRPQSGTSGGVMSAISSIGSWLASPQGLNSVVNLGTAIVKTQGTIESGKVQMAVIQAQAQRAAAGLPPAPITYTLDANGNRVPVYDTGTNGYMPPDLESAIASGRAHAVTLPDGSVGYVMDGSTLNSVLNFSSIPLWAWLLLGGVVIYAVA